jgi:dephospho-CoA kinase
MPRIIALTGLCGSGKTTAALMIEKLGYQYLRFGQIVIDTLQEKGLEVTPENERLIRHQLREAYGMGAFAIVNRPKISNMIQKGRVVIDGMYSFEEYKILTEQFHDEFITLAIYAPPNVRYNRLEDRFTQTGDLETRFRPLTKKEAKKRDYDEIENASKSGPIAIADWTILNIDTLQHLEKEVKEFVCRI